MTSKRKEMKPHFDGQVDTGIKFHFTAYSPSGRPYSDIYTAKNKFIYWNRSLKCPFRCFGKRHSQRRFNDFYRYLNEDSIKKLKLLIERVRNED
jgi:hypothetical protein